MLIENGNIYDTDTNYYADSIPRYRIDKISAKFEEDMDDVIGVVRCTGITIESEAPCEINSQVQTELYNKFADIEYNNAGEESFELEAKNDISEETGVDKINIIIEL